jgi:hypothetical protein
MKNTAVSKEVALDDLEKFVNYYSKKPVERSTLSDGYPDVLDAIMEGYLSFDENQVPKLKLKDAIKGEESGNVVLDSLDFKTRIKPLDKANLGKGLSITTDILTYQLRITAHIIGQPISMLDKLSPYDYDVVSQVASVFP